MSLTKKTNDSSECLGGLFIKSLIYRYKNSHLHKAGYRDILSSSKSCSYLSDNSSTIT